MNGTTRPPYRYRIQRIGRPNGSSPLPSSSIASQRICFGNDMPAQHAGQHLGQHVDRGLAALMLAHGDVFALRRLDALDLIFGGALLLDEARAGRRERAIGVECRRTPAARSRALRDRSAAREICADRTVRRRGVLKVSIGSSVDSRASFRLAPRAPCRSARSARAASWPESLPVPISSSSSRSIIRLRAPRLPRCPLPDPCSPHTPYRSRARADARARM